MAKKASRPSGLEIFNRKEGGPIALNLSAADAIEQAGAPGTYAVHISGTRHIIYCNDSLSDLCGGAEMPAE